jgi:hypothetical protein
LGQEALASLAQFDVINSEKISFDYKKVCDVMGAKEAVIITAPTVNQLDCMGTKVTIIDFCLKDYAKDSKFIRAFVEPKQKVVICEKAKRVILKYQCETKDSERCLDSEIACFDLKKTLAYNLKVFHHSAQGTKDKKVISCIFDSEN